MPAEPVELVIDRLGAAGDGVASGDGTALHVALTLPGERVLARPSGRARADLLSLLRPGPDRVSPPCPLFGACGGCVLQHQAPAVTLDWKTARIAAALRDAGFPALPPDIQRLQSPPLSRRRMDLAIRREPDGTLLVGLHRRGEAAVADMVRCHVLHPALFAVLDALRPVLQRLQGLRRAGSLLVNLLDSGPDLLLCTDGPLHSRDRTLLAEFAAAHAVPRIAWRPEGGREPPELVSLLGPVGHRFAGAPTDAVVQPPPGAFLQATKSGESAIVAAVTGGLPPRLPRSATVVELYSGCGTLSFALSAAARVAAFEGDPAAVAALRAAGAGRRIEARARDLNRQPVPARELATAAAVVLDPPHAGAGAQMPEVARSGAGRVIYVSCNPAALGRDAAMLSAAGYTLSGLTVIDQFLWAADVECVAVFERPVLRRRGPMPRPDRSPRGAAP